MRPAACAFAVLAILIGLPTSAAAQRPSVHSWRIGDDLRGTFWQARTINGMPVAEPDLMTIEFLQAGDQVRGQAGCNRFVGPFASRADKINLGILRQSRADCPADQAAMQKAFVDMLHAAYIAEINGRVLTLTSRQGATLTLTPRPR
jgi:heat shock protein HslJ